MFSSGVPGNPNCVPNARNGLHRVRTVQDCCCDSQNVTSQKCSKRVTFVTFQSATARLALGTNRTLVPRSESWKYPANACWNRINRTVSCMREWCPECPIPIMTARGRIGEATSVQNALMLPRLVQSATAREHSSQHAFFRLRGLNFGPQLRGSFPHKSATNVALLC